MSIREFELFHGAVLTKLVRSDRPVTLRMIETKPGEAWSIYTINDAVRILLKHNTSGRKLKRDRGGSSWPFVFSKDQLSQIQAGNVWVALVCGGERLGQAVMEVCLITPDEIKRLVDLGSGSQQSVTVKRLPGKSLRISSVRVNEVIVPRNRLETWDIPGS